MKTTSIISDKAELGNHVIIEEFCIIGYGQQSGNLSEKIFIGHDSVIRSHSVIYLGNTIGDYFMTGHGVLIREKNNIGSHVSIGSHTIIEHHIHIGDYVRIQGGTFIPEYTSIHEGAWIGPMVTFTNSKYPGSKHSKKNLIGAVIGKGAKIGAGSILLPGVKIGENAFIGAGSVITKDIESGAVVVGNPMKVINKTASLRFSSGEYAYQ